jgi:hypothetical protein
MNAIIREKRRLAFNSKRITPKTIRSFCKLIESEIEALEGAHKESFYKMYSVDATDNTSFESQSEEIFAETQVIETRVVRKISMRFYTLDSSKSIEIQIVDLVKDENSENFLMVSGDDPTWVNGILTRLSTILDTAENQAKIRGSGWLVFAVLILFNVEYFRLSFDYFPKINELVFTIFMFVVPVGSIICAVKIHNYIETLWPSIELQTGPDYQRIPNRRRNKLQWLAASIILPLLLSIVYDIVKNTL